MSELAHLFAGANFRQTITRYCDEQDWIIADLNDRKAVLRFDMESGRTQTCYIIKFDFTLEFSVPSGLAFKSVDDVPHYFSSLLLMRSREKKIGFWCLEEIQGKQVYSVMHNAEMRLIDGNYFASVVRALVRECDDFEDVIEKL